ncbi:MAG TPA: C45 family peptidase [Candidatus Acidoferrales bacterium]|nr:C45 family peptidase [Candidatus Acidoferrales bacterium]
MTLLDTGREMSGARIMRSVLAISLLVSQLAAFSPLAAARAANRQVAEDAQNSYLEKTQDKGYRFDRGGWIYVHLEGSPHDIGFQHGYLLAPEIADAFAAIRLESTHSTGRDWEFFRRAAREMLWRKIDPEYQAELQGIVDGLDAKKVKLDLDDIVALNAFQELPEYYVPWLDSITRTGNARRNSGEGHCSAFVATGSWTKDRQIVMAHSNWTSYVEGARWRIIFDIVPQTGFHILMDGFPGVIASDDDFGVNSGGLMVTETTIANFHGWDTNGKAEFVRARKALQYAGSIDDYVKIMLDGNNGGYANDWLLGDRKTGEIARFELGLRHTKLWRTKDGYFDGSNFPSDPELIKNETNFDPDNPANGANARHVRWGQLLNGNRGKIDIGLGEIFLADHYDTYKKKEGADRRTLCGHYDATSESTPGSTPYDPYGAVQGKVMDSRMAEAMDFIARIGHPCGINFDAAKFLSEHPEYSWEAPVLGDMIAGPWTEFRSGEHVAQAAP